MLQPRYELLAIGDGDYLRYDPERGTIGNVICDANGNVVAMFTVALDPDAPPITRAEADKIAEHWRHDHAHWSAQDRRDAKMHTHRIATNRRRFFHR